MGWTRNAVHIWKKINAYCILLGKPEGEIALGRLRCRRRIILKWILEK
jgi:hypothetical protein